MYYTNGRTKRNLTFNPKIHQHIDQSINSPPIYRNKYTRLSSRSHMTNFKLLSKLIQINKIHQKLNQFL